jgi:hypothetical protein
MSRSEALSIAAGVIAKSVPDVGALAGFLEIGGAKRLAAALREQARARPVELGGRPKCDPEVWRRGRVG